MKNTESAIQVRAYFFSDLLEISRPPAKPARAAIIVRGTGAADAAAKPHSVLNAELAKQPAPTITARSWMLKLKKDFIDDLLSTATAWMEM